MSLLQCSMVLTATPALLAAAAFIIMIVLNFKKIPGSIIIGIVLATVVGIALGVSPFNGIIAAPPSLAATFLQLDLAGAFQIGLVTIISAFLFVDLFDTAGTLIGIAHRAGFLDEQGKLPRIRKALIADSVATIAGAAIGTSTTTSYIEPGFPRWMTNLMTCFADSAIRINAIPSALRANPMSPGG